MNQFKTALGSGVMTLLTIAGTFPAIAGKVPSQSREACIQRTAEEMGVATRDINVISTGPLSAESGAVTLFMRNVKTRQTAECRVNTIDSTVLSVNLGNNNSGSNPSAQKPEYWVVSVNRTYLKSSPGIFSNTVNNDVMRGTVLRNLGCQRKELPTWCQVELRDNPQLKGWAFTPNLKEYIANSSQSRPSTSQPEAGTTVSRLKDLVGARAGQAENAIKDRGYTFVKSSPSGNAIYSQWIERKTNYCVTIQTQDGRYQSIVYAGNSVDCQASNTSSVPTSQPDAGTTVSRLKDLVGARAGQAENAVKDRGYKFVKSSPSGNAIYSQWLERKTNYCVTIQTQDGRYQSIVYAGGSADCEN